MKTNMQIIFWILLAGFVFATDTLAQEGNKNQIKDMSGDFAVVVHGNANVYKEPTEDISRRLEVEVKLFDVLEFIEEQGTGRQQRDRGFYKVKLSGDGSKTTSEGWMRAQDVMTQQLAMKVGELDRRQKDNPILAKLAVRNYIETTEVNGNRQVNYYTVDIKDRPGENGSVLNRANLFRAYYVYNAVRGDDSGIYYLIGKTPELKPEEPKASLVGWVPADAVFNWYSRLAVHFEPSTWSSRRNANLPVRIFETEDAVIDYIEQNVTDSAEVLVREDFCPTGGDCSAQISLRHDQWRWPVMTDRPDYVQLIYIADPFSTRDGEMAGACRLAPETRRREAIALEAALGRRDVLFLVDGTFSLEDFFEPAKRAIDGFMRVRSSQARSDYRFGIALYRDFTEGSDVFEVVSPLTTNYEAVKASLSNVKAYSDPSDVTLREALYEGLHQSLSSAEVGWHQDTQKAIVVIGDHGGHNNERRKQEINALLNDPLISLYGLNVFAREDVMEDTYNNLFIDQLTRFKNVGANGRGKIEQLPRGISADDADVKILEVLESYRVTSRNFLDIVTEIFKSEDLEQDLRYLEGTYGAVPTRAALELLNERLGAECINLTDLQQAVGEGWAAKFVGNQKNVPQLQPSVLLSKGEIYNLSALLYRIYTNLADKGQTKGVGQTVTGYIESLTGDRYDGSETMAEFLQKVFFIPYRKGSSLLDYTPAGLEQKVTQDSEFLEKYINDTAKATAQLNSVIDEFDPEELQMETISTRSGELTKWRQPSPPVHKEWGFRPGTVDEYVWLPFKYLP